MWDQKLNGSPSGLRSSFAQVNRPVARKRRRGNRARKRQEADEAAVPTKERREESASADPTRPLSYRAREKRKKKKEERLALCGKQHGPKSTEEGSCGTSGLARHPEIQCH